MRIKGWGWILILGLFAFLSMEAKAEAQAVEPMVTEPKSVDADKVQDVPNNNVSSTKHHLPSWRKTALIGTAIVALTAGGGKPINTAIVAVGIGGALGSITRYVVSQSVVGWLEQDYPYGGTMTVNILGSFVFGLVSGWAGLRDDSQEGAWFALVTTGFLGGFTTFSLFAHDTVGLAHQEGFYMATAYTMLSVGVSIAALLIGEFVGSALSVP